MDTLRYYFSIKAGKQGWQFRRGISVGNTADYRATVADLHVSNVLYDFN